MDNNTNEFLSQICTRDIVAHLMHRFNSNSQGMLIAYRADNDAIVDDNEPVNVLDAVGDWSIIFGLKELWDLEYKNMYMNSIDPEEIEDDGDF